MAEDPLKHQGLVGSIAKLYVGRGLDLDDLKQIGNLGLLRAIQDYDPTRSSFSTHATKWIKEAIRGAIRDQARPIRLPRWVRTKLNKGASPDDPSLTPKCRECLKAAIRVLGAEREDEGLHPLFVVAEPEPEPDHDFAEVAPRLAKLESRDRQIISMRFGLGGDPLSRTQIGAVLKLTRERVRQLEVKALERLREPA